MTQSEIPILNKFRTSITTGGDYSSPGRPTPIKLTVSQDGINTREAQTRIQKLTNIKNEWDVIGAEADVRKSMNVAHQKTYEAMGSEISAAAAFVGASTAYYGWETAVARNQIAEGERNLAVASVPIELNRQATELQRIVLTAEQTALEANRLQDDVNHVRVMNALNGYNTDITIPVAIYNQPEGLSIGAGSNG